jgi:hypothetical protein
MKKSMKTILTIISSTILFLSEASAHEGHDDSSLASEFVTVSGTVEVLSFDDFKNKRSVKQFFLVDDQSGNKYELHFKNSAPSGFLKKQKAKIRGQLFNSKDILVNVKDIQLAAANGDGTGGTGTTAAASVTGDRKTLVLVMDSNDSVARCSAAQLNDLFFAGTTSINGMYKDASNGLLSLSGNVYDRVKINVNTAGLSCDTNYSIWSSMASQSAQQMGISTTGYNNIVYILPSNASCGWAGLGSLGSGSAWIAGNYCATADVSAHELGHNFGMHHARGNGSEYGDTSDIMGSGGVGLRTLNAAHMDYMGWAPVNKIVTAGIGTYEVAALEADPASTALPLMVKVANPVNGGYFYFSLRQRIGYDANLSTTYADRLNIHTNQGGYSDFLAALTDGGTYSHAASGLSVTVNFRTPASVNFTVSGQCTLNTPQISISPSIQSAAAGQTKSYTVTLINRDGGFCNPTRFDLSAVLPVGLSSDSGTKSVTVSPGASSSVTFNVTSSTNLTAGTYSFSIQSQDADRQAQHTVSSTAQYMIDGIAPSNPTGLRLTSAKGKTVKLAWNASTDNVAVVGYEVFRNGVKVGTTSVNSYNENVGRGTFTYQVRAVDGAGNVSGLSTAISVNK